MTALRNWDKIQRVSAVNADFLELTRLIDLIQALYDETTDKWKAENGKLLNFKKTQIADMDRDETIYGYVLDYVQFLNAQSGGLTLKLAMSCDRVVTARVKAQNSIAFKIQNYKTESHEFGRIPINKCLNDLFGIRIILEEPVEYKELADFVEKAYPGKYRCIDSSKLDYKAVHLYFRKDNQSFPWELQIWNKCNAESNFASHKKYKQEYTLWEKENREGGIVDG